MKKLLAIVCLGVFAGLGRPSPASAQSLLITNARILDGTGGLIERGALVVRDGTIVSISTAAPVVPGARVIDANGMTVMPGFIESHRHVIRGNAAQWMKEEAVPRMQEFLDAGFTTVLSAGDSLQEIIELRRQLQQGVVKGPRLIVTGRAPLARPAAPAGGGGGRAAGPGGDPARFDVSRPPLRPTQAAVGIPAEETRATIETLAKAGVDAIKTAIITTPGGPEKDTLALIVREGKRHNIPTITHAVSVLDTLAAVDAGVASLVHTPHIGRLEEDAAAVQTIAKSGIPMMSTLGIFIPHFDEENKPTFRDRGPFPMATISSGGQGPVNARLLWEAGITYGYGTDSTWLPKESFAQELRALNLMFSPKDIVSILTRNAAATILRGNRLGTLEAGKIADIVMLNGDPLANVTNLLNVVVVIKEGAIVVDRR